MATRDGGMKSTSINGVKMYTIASQQPSLASWLPSNKKQNSHRNVKSILTNLSHLFFLIHSFAHSSSFRLHAEPATSRRLALRHRRHQNQGHSRRRVHHCFRHLSAASQGLRGQGARLEVRTPLGLRDR